MLILVALGNPGEKYKNTRHNVAWLALDHFLEKANWVESKKFKALLYQEGDFLFVKPLTFMNLSGESVRKIMDYYKLIPKKLGIIDKKDSDLSSVLTVIHDDVDLSFGKIKNSINSGSAGHNGIKSIMKELKTKNFKRIRIGVKNDLLKNPIPTDKFVLQNFSEEEKKSLKEIFSNLEIKK